MAGDQGEGSRRVHILRDSVARRIAAGEVIDRPHSVIRELMDNALDAGASNLDLTVEQGGVRRIRLADNGRGMTPEDMDLAWKPHATSKITEVEDLEKISSLGFRGEALSSIAACSRLEITSRPPDSPEAWYLAVHGGKEAAREPRRGQPGTIIDVSDLFYSLPARRRFLKSPSAETRLCRTTFLEKALPFPGCSFRLTTDGKLRLNLPAASLLDRVVQAFENRYPPQLLTEESREEPGLSVKMVAGTPDIHRKDRRHIHIYVNRRRIDEFAFVQAVEYGFSGTLPGGMFPVAFVFIEVDPALVDFNIHPAKREARFRDKGRIHRTIVQLLQNATGPRRRQAASPQPRPFAPGLSDSLGPGSAAGLAPPSRADRFRTDSRYADLTSPRPAPEASAAFTQEVRQRQESSQSPREDVREDVLEVPPRRIRYLGQVMNLFLLAEADDTLYIIDQHAAHERINYNRLRRGTGESQGLLVPWETALQREEADFILSRRQDLEKIGFSLEISAPSGENPILSLTAVPAAAREGEREILEFLKNEAGNPQGWEKRLYALLSCRSAVKDGETLDEQTARGLVEQALALPEPRCPHGRPVWFELTRTELYDLLGRT